MVELRCTIPQDSKLLKPGEAVMIRAKFDADVIAELRLRVCIHNKATHGARTRLEELKKVWRQNHRGMEPRRAAMNGVQRHIERLAVQQTGEIRPG